MGFTKPKLYRDAIDEMVRSCHEGQGQISSRWVLSGDWLSHLDADTYPEEHATSQFVAGLSQGDRQILAKMLEQSFEGGMFNALVCLEKFEIAPFEDGYEGSAFNDFIGRLTCDWDWPER